MTAIMIINNSSHFSTNFSLLVLVFLLFLRPLLSLLLLLLLLRKSVNIDFVNIIAATVIATILVIIPSISLVIQIATIIAIIRIIVGLMHRALVILIGTMGIISPAILEDARSKILEVQKVAAAVVVVVVVVLDER